MGTYMASVHQGLLLVCMHTILSHLLQLVIYCLCTLKQNMMWWDIYCDCLHCVNNMFHNCGFFQLSGEKLFAVVDYVNKIRMDIFW